MGLQLAAAFATVKLSCCLAQGPRSSHATAHIEIHIGIRRGGSIGDQRGEWTTQIVLTSYRTALRHNPDLVLRPRRGLPLTVPLLVSLPHRKSMWSSRRKELLFVQTQQPSTSVVGWALTDIPCSGQVAIAVTFWDK